MCKTCSLVITSLHAANVPVKRPPRARGFFFFFFFFFSLVPSSLFFRFLPPPLFVCVFFFFFFFFRSGACAFFASLFGVFAVLSFFCVLIIFWHFLPFPLRSVSTPPSVIP